MGLKSFQILMYPFIAISLFAVPTNVIWNNLNKFKDWGEAVRLNYAISKNAMILTIKERDSSIANRNVKINPRKFNFLQIEYKASGLSARTKGQLFYANTSQKNFIGNQYWKISNLKSDDKWHTLSLIADNKNIAYGVDKWLNCGIIDKIRLDMVDQAAGKIKIRSISFSQYNNKIMTFDNSLKFFFPNKYFLLKSETCKSTIYLPEKKFYVWLKFKNFENLTRINNLLKDIKIFPFKVFSQNKIMNISLSKWYLWGNSSGGKTIIEFPAKYSDKFEGILFTTSHLPSDYPQVSKWDNVKSEIKTKSQQTLNSPIDAPYWSGYMIKAPTDTPHSIKQQNNNNFFLRRKFTIPKDFKSAFIQVSADDYFTLYLNGKKILSNKNPNSWQKPSVMEVSQLLRKGEENIIAVNYTNMGGPGGVLMELLINNKDGSYKKIVSDKNFLCSNKKNSGWNTLPFDDSNWKKPVIQMAPPANPWNKILPYSVLYDVPEIKMLSAKCPEKVFAGKILNVHWRLKTSMAVRKNTKVNIKITSSTGKEIIEKNYNVSDISTYDKDKVLVLSLKTKMPEYLQSANFTINLKIHGFKVNTPQKLNFTFVNNKTQIENVNTEIRKTPCGPQLFVNGQEKYMMIGNCRFKYKQSGFENVPMDFRTFWARNDDSDRAWWVGPDKYDFSAIDMIVEKILSNNPDAMLIPFVGIAPGRWWAAKYPAEISKFSNNTVFNYGLASPSFSSEQFLRDSLRALNRFIEYCEKSSYKHKIAGYVITNGYSAEWQGWGCHNTVPKLMDYSLPAQKAFKKFVSLKFPSLKNKNIKIPPIQERLLKSTGIFKDLEKDFLSVEYDDFYSKSITDFIIKACTTAKEVLADNKIIGIYYGYSMEYGNLGWALQMSGHNRLGDILESDKIDFLLSPPSYGLRNLGDCGEDMKPFASIKQAGKLSIIDDDTRTHLTPTSGFFQTVNAEQTEQIVRRNLGRALCRQNPVCLYPLTFGNEFNSKAITNDIKKIKTAAQFMLDNKIPRKAEIAIVLNERSIKYLNYENKKVQIGTRQLYSADGTASVLKNLSQRLTGELTYFQRRRIAQIGAPVDYILIDDVSKNINKYKLWIFLNCFEYNKANLDAIKRLQRTKSTLLWAYAPGFFYMNDANIKNMEKLTGFKFSMLKKAALPIVKITNFTSQLTQNCQQTHWGVNDKVFPLFYVDDPGAKCLGKYWETNKPALAVKKINNSTSIFCGSNILPWSMLRNIANYSKVHIYCNTGDYVFANDAFLTFHSRTTGLKKIFFQKKCDVVDLFTKKILKRNTSSYSFKTILNTTRVFYLGNAEFFKQNTTN